MLQIRAKIAQRLPPTCLFREKDKTWIYVPVFGLEPQTVKQKKGTKVATLTAKKKSKKSSLLCILEHALHTHSHLTPGCC